MILTKVEIINFQSHEKTVIDFTSGVNGLVGSSNAGKSSVFRAIRWNVKNEPSGHRFIRNGESEATVITHWSDGHAIERTRNKGSKNYYAIYKVGALIEEFTGFGSNVPEKVNEITNMWDDHLNFSNQMESPFLLSETPKRRAEIIGNVEELGKIDVEITNVNRDIDELKKEEKRLTKELQAEKRKLSKLEIEVEEEKDKVAFLNMVKQGIQEKERLIENLERSKNRVLQVNDELQKTSEVVEKAKRITSNWDDTLPQQVELAHTLTVMHQKLHQIDTEIQTISFLDKQTIQELTSLTETITYLKSTFHTLERFYDELTRIKKEEASTKSSYNKSVAEMDLEPIDLEIERYTHLFRHHKRLKTIEKEQLETQQIIDETKSKITSLLYEFTSNLKDMQICPTCSQSTEHVTVETVQNAMI